jgi:peptide/nickel transport system permease protein
MSSSDTEPLLVPSLPEVSSDGAATPLPAEAVAAAAPALTPAPGTRRRKKLRIGLWLGIAWLALTVFLALTASLLPWKPPDHIGSALNRSPGFRLSDPLGTDNLGRSILSRIVFGGRVSLSASFGGIGVALLVGVPLGLVAGYFRRYVDTVTDIVISVILAFPPLIFLIALNTILQPSVKTLVFSLGFLGMPAVSRVARAKTISVANLEYVTAARAMGMSGRRIVFREILPNILPSVLSYALILAAVLMVAEGSLSFLGLGIRPPTPSWGAMVSDSIPQLSTYPYQMLVPACVFFLTVLALNTVGNWARARAERRYS